VAAPLGREGSGEFRQCARQRFQHAGDVRRGRDTITSPAPALPNAAASAASAGSPVNGTWADSRISAGSRPAAAQRWYSTSRAR